MQQSLFDLEADPSLPRSPPPAGRRARTEAGPPLSAVVLGSGSAGNAVVVESGGRRLLVDAGFSCRELVRRLASAGIDPESIEALLLTHEHEDHCRGADRFCGRYGVPLYATAGTLAGLAALAALRAASAPEDRPSRAARPRGAPPTPAPSVLRSGEPLELAGFVVEAFLVPHDAREPVGFLLEDGAGRRVGLVADLGSRSRLAWGRLSDLDLLILEANHDLDMLRNGPYPWPVKQRVAGRHGHLSNDEAARGAAELVSDRLAWVVLYHLSRTNNLPALAAQAVGEALAREGSGATLVVSEQDRATPRIEVR